MASIAAPPETAPPTSATRRPPGQLAGNAVGLGQVLFMIVTGAAPIAAMLFNVPVAVSGGGSAAPAGFLVATVALTIFSVGYVAMAKRVTAAGGFYSFISHGLGQTVATGAGLLIWLCYVAFAASVLGVCGYFAHTTLQDFFSHRCAGVGCRAPGFGTDVGAGVVRHRIDGEGARCVFDARGRGARGPGRGHPGPGRAPTASAPRRSIPGALFNNAVGDQGVRCRGRRGGVVRGVLVLGGLRDGAQLRRGVTGTPGA